MVQTKVLIKQMRDMKATELRIGNLFDFHGQTVHVMAIYKDDFATFGYFTDSIGFDRQFEDEIRFPNPIPLTLEWIEKFCFNYNDKGARYLDAIVYDHIESSFRLIKYHGGKNTFHLELASGSRRYVREVHDLQNLFHAITGQELELKP